MIEGTQKPLCSNVVTLVGSMRHYDQMLEAGSKLSQDGWLVIHPFRDPNADNLSVEKAAMYDAKIRASIDMSDAIFVINVDGYIGKSTNSEIVYAFEHGKHVMYLEEPYDQVPNKKAPIVTLIGSGLYKDRFDLLEKSLISRGYIVFTPAIFKFNPDYLTPIMHQTLDRLHQEKMMMSDEIIVVNPGGYIGENTKEEIDYAKAHGLTIKYLDSSNDTSNIDDSSNNNDHVSPTRKLNTFYDREWVRIVAGGYIGQTGVILSFEREASAGSTEKYLVEIRDPKDSANSSNPIELFEGKDLIPIGESGHQIADKIDRTSWLHYMVYQVLPRYQYDLGIEVHINEGDHRGKIGTIVDCGRVFVDSPTDKHYENYYKIKVPTFPASEVFDSCIVAERIISPITTGEEN